MAETEVPEWHSSPSYPPQTLFDTSAATGRYVPSYHPAFADMVSKYPTDICALPTYVNANCAALQTDRNCDALLFFGRPFGLPALGETAVSRTLHSNRLVLASNGLRGDMNYDVSLVTSSTDATQYLLWTRLLSVGRRLSEGLGAGLCKHRHTRRRRLLLLQSIQ